MGVRTVRSLAETIPMLEFEGILRRNRALQELLELARTVVADGVVTKVEAEAFRHWVDINPDMAGVWPVEIVTRSPIWIRAASVR